MKKFALILFCFLVIGCTSAQRSKYASLGQPHTVELYSGGQMVRSWTSTGVVLNEPDSDGFFFTDSETDVLVRVSGDLVLTPVTHGTRR